MAGGISFAEDVRNANEKGEKARLGRAECGATLKDLYGDKGYPREMLKQAIAEAKRLRKYFFGDMYGLALVTANPTDWCVTQYHRTKEQDGMILAFRRPQAPAQFQCAPLRGIDPQASVSSDLCRGLQTIRTCYDAGIGAHEA